jgi:CheY-like chemotaxis protein
MMQPTAEIASASQAWVMVVEDDPDHAMLIRTGLEASPHVRQVRVIRDGEQALDCVRLESVAQAKLSLPDLVLLDLKLPRVDGIEVLRAIRRSPLWQNVPVVILSTSGRQADMQACYANGANAYVTKVGPSGLVTKVSELARQWLAATVTTES